MTIKQLEQQLEIPRATIRFYEKEKLINPKRNDNSYREYDDEDVVTLKKIIILRKIGLSVSDIKKVLDGECSLQSLLQKNILELENQIKELEGAISVTKIMKDRNEDIFSLDENMYWREIDELEKSGLKFKELLNDVFELSSTCQEYKENWNCYSCSNYYCIDYFSNLCEYIVNVSCERCKFQASGEFEST